MAGISYKKKSLDDFFSHLCVVLSSIRQQTEEEEEKTTPRLPYNGLVEKPKRIKLVSHTTFQTKEK